MKTMCAREAGGGVVRQGEHRARKPFINCFLSGFGAISKLLVGGGLALRRYIFAFRSIVIAFVMYMFVVWDYNPAQVIVFPSVYRYLT